MNIYSIILKYLYCNKLFFFVCFFVACEFVWIWVGQGIHLWAIYIYIYKILIYSSVCIVVYGNIYYFVISQFVAEDLGGITMSVEYNYYRIMQLL